MAVAQLELAGTSTAPKKYSMTNDAPSAFLLLAGDLLAFCFSLREEGCHTVSLKISIAEKKFTALKKIVLLKNFASNFFKFCFQNVCENL